MTLPSNGLNPQHRCELVGHGCRHIGGSTQLMAHYVDWSWTAVLWGNKKGEGSKGGSRAPFVCASIRHIINTNHPALSCDLWL